MNSKNDQLIEISDPIFLVFRLFEKNFFWCLESTTNPPPPLSVSFYQNELLWVVATSKLLIKKSRLISHLILKLFRGQISIEVRCSNEF